MSERRSISEIKAALTERVEALARELIPDGGYGDNRREWVATATKRGGVGDSFKVRLQGPKAGLWMHGAAGKKGDILSLIAYQATGGDNGQAVRWALRWLGWDGPDDSGPQRSPKEEARLRAEREQRAEAARSEAAAEVVRRQRGAQAMFMSASNRLRGTPVDRYLAGRGIFLGRLAELGTVPGAIRYAESMPLTVDTYYPALVAAVTRPPDTPDAPSLLTAVQRIYLAASGGGWGKAPVRPNKKAYGALTGHDSAGPWAGAVYLWRGQRKDRKTGLLRLGRPIASLMKRGPESEDEATLLICEGIEDGLTAALAWPRWRIWAGVSLTAMRSLRIPAPIERVVYVADNDPHTHTIKGVTGPHPARLARQAVIESWQAQGKKVLVAEPQGAKDLNEIAIKGVAHG